MYTKNKQNMDGERHADVAVKHAFATKAFYNAQLGKQTDRQQTCLKSLKEDILSL